MNETTLKKVLRANAAWFINSGVMNPSDGRWGVAERVLLTTGNASAGQSINTFPAWSHFDDCCILEQRRADCNFETAYYFLRLAELFNDENYAAIAGQIINFLYNLSGLLSYDEKLTGYPTGSWNWSHIRWTPAIWFDDNAWCIILALKIAALRPDLNRKYRMTEIALAGAENLKKALENHKEEPPPQSPPPAGNWLGNLRLPHWGALAMAALAAAAPMVSPEKRGEWAAVNRAYYDDVIKRIDSLNPSEQSYTLIGASFAARAFDTAESGHFASIAGVAAANIIRAIDPGSGCLPSGHYEAPQGEHLADLIYTQNWALVGLQLFRAISQDQAISREEDRQIEIITGLQDNTPDQRLNGCWRGMFDVKNNNWGGGDCYEGGAGSIYTGWTNAPIGWTVANRLLGGTLLD